MSIAVPLVLLSRRRDVAAMLEGDPGVRRYEIEIVDPAAASDALARCRAVILDGPGVEGAAALARRIRREHPSLEQLAVVGDERGGVDAIRGGAHDFVVWPPREPAALWMAVASLVDRAGPGRRRISGTVGGYSLVERLGSGGMADVFLARKPGEEPIVLKCMRPEIAEEDRYVAMFLEEARISQALSHPNIVRVYDAGGTPDELFIAMEHVRGSNLEDIGKEAGWRFPPPIACWIAAEVAAGLDHAHRAVDAGGRRVGLIHRDVNPPNVLVREDGAVKLSDFGIAKTKRQHSRTTQGVLRGKLEYMSPEQVDALPLDARTDVFSLGTVLYRMLTGELPFTGTTTLQILQRIQQARCEPPSAHDSAIPASLDAIVMKALARDRDARYESADAFERDLRTWVTAAGGASREDVAAFVRDAAAVRSGGVVPRGSSERGRETLAKMPSIVTVLSPPRAVVEVTVTSAASPLGVAPQSATAGDPTIAPRAEPTLPRAVPPGEPTAEREIPASVAREVTVSRETAAPGIDATSISPAPRFEDRHDRDTVSRAAAPLFPDAAHAPRWLRPAAIGGGAIVLALGYLANPFGGDRETSHPPRGEAVGDGQTAHSPRGEAVGDDQTARPPRGEAVGDGQTARPPRGDVRPVASQTKVAIAATPRPTVAPLRKGTVSIWVTDGWAAVSVDGKSLGLNAPVIGLELLEGKHRVTLENAPLRVRKDYEVVIAPGEETKLRVSIR